MISVQTAPLGLFKTNISVGEKVFYSYSAYGSRVKTQLGTVERIEKREDGDGPGWLPGQRYGGWRVKIKGPYKSFWSKSTLVGKEALDKANHPFVDYVAENTLETDYPPKDPDTGENNFRKYATIRVSMERWTQEHKFVPSKDSIRGLRITFKAWDNRYSRNINLTGYIHDYKKTEYGDIILVFKELEW